MFHKDAFKFAFTPDFLISLSTFLVEGHCNNKKVKKGHKVGPQDEQECHLTAYLHVTERTEVYETAYWCVTDRAVKPRNRILA